MLMKGHAVKCNTSNIYRPSGELIDHCIIHGEGHFLED